MITDIHLWVESNEREIEVNGFPQTTYGYPRSYYKVSHFTDTLLLELSYSSLRLWHYSLSLLSTSTDIEQCVTVKLIPAAVKHLISRNSYYKAIKELVKYRLLLPTVKPNVYVINIQHSHKLNTPNSYMDAIIPKHKTLQATVTDYNANLVDDRPLCF